MDIWVIGILNQLFIRRFYNQTKFSKNKVVRNKKAFYFLCDKFISYNPYSILFALTLAFDSAVLHGKVAFTILVLLTKTVLLFLKKIF